MLTTKIIELEMSAQPKRGFTEVKQNDADGVQLKLILRNSDYTAYLIPDGAVVSFLAVKSDKKSVVLSSTDDNPRVTYTANSNIVLVTLPAQVLAVAGIILCNVTISKSGATTSTQTFTLSCAEALIAEDLTASYEFQSLSKMLADLTARKAEFDAINDKIANMALGYGGTFATLAALQADANANTPDGKKRFYIVAADGHHYYWSNINSAWTDGGTIIPYADVTALKDGIVNTNKRLGYGVRNNGLKVTPTEPASNMVNISGGTFDMPDGRYFEISSTSINVNANNTSLPRTDIIYVSKYGALSYLAGTVNIVAGQRTYTLTTNFGYSDEISVCGISVLAGPDFDYTGGISAAISNLADALNATTGFESIYTASASGNVLTITEKVAGGGNTPTIMTIDGTGVVVNGTAIVSTATSTPAALPEGGELLYRITMPAGATTVIESYLIDARKFTNGLYSYVKDKTFESVGARINEIEEDAETLEARVAQAETDIDSLQTSIAGHDAEIDALQVRAAQTDAEIDALRVAQAQMSGDTRINLNGTGKITAVPKNAAILGIGGTIKGMTITPLVAQSNVAVGGSVSFASVSGNKYYDGLHKTILTSTGSTMTVTNDTTAAANINVIDLTAHGLQNKTAAEILQICPNYISGTQSVTPMRVKSIGKNIFNIDKPLKYYKTIFDKNYPLKIENGIIYSAGKNGATWGESVYVETNGLPVTISFDAEWSSDTSDTKFCKFTLFNELASDRVISSNFSDSTTRTIQEKNVITVPANNYKYVGISFWGIEPYKVRIKNLQIEYGTEATEYELYKETTCYIEPKPLRRLPNGVCDTVDLATGKRTLYIDENGEELATPIIENNVVTGTLLSYPKGLIVCEPVIADAGIYNNGIFILRTAYPIQSLETLCKVNADGTQTPLDVSTAVIASGGLSFTHPGISNGDIVAFTYFTASSGIIGENVYNYVNANGLTLGANGKYYRVGFAIDASGNISLTKTEVV